MHACMPARAHTRALYPIPLPQKKTTQQAIQNILTILTGATTHTNTHTNRITSQSFATVKLFMQPKPPNAPPEKKKPAEQEEGGACACACACACALWIFACACVHSCVCMLKCILVYIANFRSLLKLTRSLLTSILCILLEFSHKDIWQMIMKSFRSLLTHTMSHLTSILVCIARVFTQGQSDRWWWRGRWWRGVIRSLRCNTSQH